MKIRNKLPHEYVGRQVQFVNGAAIQFTQNVKTLNSKKAPHKRKQPAETPSIEYHTAQEEYEKPDSIVGKKTYQSSVVLSSQPSIFKKVKLTKGVATRRVVNVNATGFPTNIG